MKMLKYQIILPLALVSISYGVQSLKINSQSVEEVIIKLGETVTVEVISDDASNYLDTIGFDYCTSLGNFVHIETKPAAGNYSNAWEITDPNFCGWYVYANELFGGPTPGVHFVLQYTAQQVGQVDLKLYDGAVSNLIDSVSITIIPAEITCSFKYQGRLIDDGHGTDDTYDFQFRLFDSPTGGNQVGLDVDVADVNVMDGYFTVELDFGCESAQGDDVWLDIGVRPGSEVSSYTYLSPRQQLTPAPYSAYARTSAFAVSSVTGIGTSNYIPKFDDSKVLGNSVVFQSAGNVGISTTEPYGKLQIDADMTGAGSQLVLRSTDAPANGGNWGFRANQSGFSLKNYSDTFSSAGSVFYIGRTGMAIERICFPVDVNVGITDTFPDAKLEVSAYGGSADLFMLSSNNNTDGDIMVVKNDGSVGIGNTNPSTKLDVEGVVQAHGFDTGDITFRKNGKVLWRMFEEEDGLYLEQTDTGKVFKILLEEKDDDTPNIKDLSSHIRKLSEENKLMRKQIESLETMISQLSSNSHKVDVMKSKSVQE